MIEDESTFTDLLPKFDDPESPDRRQPIPRPGDYADHDDDIDDRPSSKRNPHHHLYEKHFTPREREMLAAIPENDVSYEINLLRYLLDKTFELIPTDPRGKKSPISLKFHFDMISVFTRSAILISRLVVLHNKLHNSREALSAIINEVIDELDPNDMSTYDWDLI